MNKLYLLLSILMGVVVLVSNFLVQFPVNYLGLSEILTYGAFSYPVAFLITDLANRSYGKIKARKIVYLGFIIGVAFTYYFREIIPIRIAIGSGTAFLVAQLIDINVFDKFRNNLRWYLAPLASSFIGLVIDTFLFFSISFYGTSVPWVSLSFGDLVVKLFVTLVMLIPFRLLLNTFREDYLYKNL